MEFQNILFTVDNGIATLTINRLEKRNALNFHTMDEINTAFERVYSDSSIHGVIITGAGDRAFVAGADISEIAQLNEITGKTMAKKGHGILFRIENSPKPVIAAVNGFALGGGCELAMACHIRIASENAKFGQPEVNLGVIPGYGGTQRLAQLVGKGKAFELLMTGDLIDAQEAHRIGLVNHVVASGELMVKSTEMMRRILTKAPLAIAELVLCVNDAFTTSGYETEATGFGNCCRTEDFKEGTGAFLSKREAAFAGK